MQNIDQLLQDRAVREIDCLRLVILFALRYETQLKGDELPKLIRRLEQRGVPEQRRKVRIALSSVNRTLFSFWTL